LGDEEAVNEIAGGETGSHGPEGPEMIDKRRAHFCGEPPKRFPFDDVQAKIPGLGAIFVQDLALHDLQTV
jgi:hypothetical protein